MGCIGMQEGEGIKCKGMRKGVMDGTGVLREGMKMDKEMEERRGKGRF